MINIDTSVLVVKKCVLNLIGLYQLTLKLKHIYLISQQNIYLVNIEIRTQISSFKGRYTTFILYSLMLTLKLKHIYLISQQNIY